MDVKFDGLKDWQKWIKSVPKEVVKDTKEAVAESGYKVESEAKWNTPVDTGRLEASITTEIVDGGLAAETFTDVEYALAVELGTMHQQAQPYLIPAFEKEYRKFNKKMKTILEEVGD